MSEYNMTKEITLPSSGKVALVRGMTGNEEDLLTDKKLLKSGKAMDKLIGSCIVEIDGEKISDAEVVKMKSADRTFILLEIRKLSYGEVIEDAEVKCSARDCNNKMYFDIDLSTLPVKESNGSEDSFEFTLPISKAGIKFRHMTGEDEHKAAKFGEGELLTVSMLLRLTEVTDGEGNEVHPNGYKKWLKNLPVRDRSALRKAMEETEIGVDTTITVECDECSQEVKTRVEGLQSFFFPEM